MAALEAGKMAPEVSLHDLQGHSFSLHDTLKRGPVVLAFFKISCPVCQYTLPFLERLYGAHKGKVNIIGVSQNPKSDTRLFVREYGITFPVLLDDARTYAASNAYGLTNVPTVFLISREGEIEVCSVGWSRRDIEEINRRVSEAMTGPPPEVFHRGEDVPDFKAG